MKIRRRITPALLFAIVGAGATSCGGAPNAAKSPARQAQDVERVIDEMLAEERRSHEARGANTASPPPPVAMPEVNHGDEFPDLEAPRTQESSDTFTQDVLRIQQVVPTWNNGTGIALKFLRESSGQRVSLVYVDPTPPVWNQDKLHWVIRATARTESQTLGHFVLLLRELAPGHYRGSAKEDAVMMSTSMAIEWDANDPDTTWSGNHESWCEIVLRQGSEPSTVEGQFRAKLIDNQGTGFHNIESGYVYIKQ
jgi:hypothetical protein